MAIDRREVYIALLAFINGGDAGILVVAPAPDLEQKRWCRWTQGPRLGPGGIDDIERLSLAMMRVGYAMGMADSWLGRDRDLIGPTWVTRTLPKILHRVGLKVTTSVPVGVMTESEIASDRQLLWDRCRKAHAEAMTLREVAMTQLQEVLDEMGGVEVDLDFSDLATGEVRGVPQEGSARRRGNAA